MPITMSFLSRTYRAWGDSLSWIRNTDWQQQERSLQDPHSALQHRLIHGGMDSFPLPVPALSNLTSTGWTWLLSTIYFYQSARLSPFAVQGKSHTWLFFCNLRRLSLSKAVLGHCHEPLRSIKAPWWAAHDTVARPVPGGRSFPQQPCSSVCATDMPAAFPGTLKDTVLNALGKTKLRAFL